MGSVASTPRGDSNPKELADYLLGVLVGRKEIAVHSNFWDRLLSLPLNLYWPEKIIDAACENIVQNSSTTGHLAKLLLHLGWSLHDASRAASETVAPLWKATNAVRFSSVFIKHLLENGTSEEIGSCLSLSLSDKEAEATGFAKGYKNVPDFVVSAIVSFIAKSNMNDSTYWLHLEVENLLLVMMSSQPRSSPVTAGDAHFFIDAAMSQDLSLVKLFVCKLLTLYTSRTTPEDITGYASLSGTNQEGLLHRVSIAAATVLRLPYYTYNYLLSPGRKAGLCPLARNSVLLLLVLVHYRKSFQYDEVEAVNGEDASAVVPQNPYSKALDLARNTDYELIHVESKALAEFAPTVSFSDLFDTLGLNLMEESSVLLLYSLLHGNAAFLEYTLVRSDLDTLLVPLMEMLYDAPRKTPKQIYMLLIILLMLSQDASFNSMIHKLVLSSVPWYKEHLLSQTTLGSLIVVILIRTVKYNLSKFRDVYLLTNCLAILSNMAPNVYRLNSYAAQRLVSLFDMLSHKYTKLSDLNSNGERAMQGGEDVSSEFNIYADFLRIVLEIINAILTYALSHNPEVIYALLHRQEIFLPFRSHPRFSELMMNLFTVGDFFNARMDSQHKGEDWSVEKVLQVIIDISRSWRSDGMKNFPKLRFTYEEEPHSEEFFSPYVWQLVVSSSGIDWDIERFTMFTSRLNLENDRAQQEV